MAKSVLIVDDEEAIRNTLGAILSDEGYRVFQASDAESAAKILDKDHPDVVLLDVWFSGSSGERQQEGLDLLSKIKCRDHSPPVIIMSGHGTIETAVKATKLGAYDFLEKPLSLDKVLLTIQNALHMQDLHRENENLRARVARNHIVIGESPGMKQLLQQVRRVAPTNSWVLITGENGTGKELIAHNIYTLSSRFNKPFVEVNCAAIPEELIESELFGHERGSFTGASQMKRGRFEAAHGGTLFLDEIGDMSLKTQAKILRILQEQRFERVGGNQTIEVDVRVIAATNKSLEDEIKKGTFRQDLYHRLNVIPIQVPPLRERKEDIEQIAAFYLKEFSVSPQDQKALTQEALDALKQYSWPGNVRELKNVIERLVILTDSQQIQAKDVLAILPSMAKDAKAKDEMVRYGTGLTTSADGPLKDARAEFEKDYILKKLKENQWNVSKTAQYLGIERSHLHKKIKSLGIEEKLTDDVKS